MLFLQRLMRLMPILIPSPFCKETAYIVLVAILMILRTLCDVWQIRIGTAIETAIISRDSRAFRRHIYSFLVAMLPNALVNNLLKYGLNEMALCFRTRLTKHLYGEYLHGFTYYKVSNLDNRINNPDQLLTQDIDKFAHSLAELYSNVSKPILDIVIYSRKLAENAGGLWAPGGMLAYLTLSGLLLTHLRRPIGHYTVREQRLEGHFRHISSRIITNSEEIAFYRGHERERHWVDKIWNKLEDHLRSVMQFRFGVGMIDTVVAKYLATVVGYSIVSRPILDLSNPRLLSSSHQEIQEEYYRSGRMMLQMAKAVGRLVLAGRELTRLAGFTDRVDELSTVLAELQEDKYQRTMVRSSSRRCLTPSASSDSLSAVNSDPLWNLSAGAGFKRVVEGVIKFDNVPIVTPNAEMLVRNLTMEVKRGMNVLICGPNGCGKSSLFRILGDLWPVWGGTLSKPLPKDIFYIPQKPYLSLGTLRDQVIYPHSLEQMRAAGRDDQELLSLLEKVALTYLVESREQSWDSIEDWADVLSGGEKQRLAMVRLYYHAPQFAILDECTSAVSADIEGTMYRHCKLQGITLLTVSHRKSLWQFHEWVLQFDGEGGAEFKPIADVEQFGS